MKRLEDLIAFAVHHPTQSHTSPAVIKRFLTELISSPRQIFTFEEESGLVAVAVLLDKVNNPSKNACLEMIAIKEGSDIEKISTFFIEKAKTSFSSHHNGFQFDFSEDSPSLRSAQKAALLFKFQSFNMLCDLTQFQDTEFDPKIEEVALGESAELFDVVCKSMSGNLDTSIPDRETWMTHFERKVFEENSESHFFLYKEKQIVGFANLVESRAINEIELRTLGVLASHRQRGIGRKLIARALLESKKRNYSSCHLRVAVHNEKALALYLKMGFKVLDKYLCYEWKK